MIDVFFILAILVTLIFLIALFAMIYHQTEHTVLHLGKNHHVK